MKKEYRSYKFWYTVSGLLIRFVFWVKPSGRENLIDGPAIVCANHSHWTDPFLVAYAFGKGYHLHMMSKVELFRNKLLGAILTSIGSFPVNRAGNDISAVRNVMKYIKAGEKVVIFPEGTRVREDDNIDAKSGAVSLASRMGVPIIPVYVPRKKRRFAPLRINIGVPYMVTAVGEKLQPSDYRAATETLMQKIQSLRV